MNIRTDLLPSGTKRRRGLKNAGIKFIVLHDVGNDGSTAKNNVDYYKRSANDESASAHVFIDDKEVVLCIPLNEKAWHVLYDRPKDNQLFGDDANDAAIGVELCYSTKGKFDSKKAYQNYIEYVASLCKTYKLDPRKKLIGHEHLDPGRKTDPTNALKHIGKTFEQCVEDIAKLVEGTKTVASTPTTSKSRLVQVLVDDLNVRTGPGTNYKVTGQVNKGEVFTVVGESNGFYKLKSGLYISSNSKYTKLK